MPRSRHRRKPLSLRRRVFTSVGIIDREPPSTVGKIAARERSTTIGLLHSTTIVSTPELTSCEPIKEKP